MSSTFKISLIITSTFVVLYLIFAFVGWETDVSTWDPVSRLAFVLLSSIGGVVLTVAALEFER